MTRAQGKREQETSDEAGVSGRKVLPVAQSLMKALEEDVILHPWDARSKTA
jgi:hypothetical protein